MCQIIYVDILISINLFVNYFTLKATAKFLYIKQNKVRMAFAALLGAIYSLYILLPYENAFCSVVIKFLMSATIIPAAFGVGNKKSFIKRTVCFYSINFAFSGCILALWYVIRPDGLIINNGMVYFNISPTLLIILTILSYAFISIINKFIGKQENALIYKKIKIAAENKEIKVNAKVDTGSSLKEPFSGLPVIVIKKERINNLLPKDVRQLPLDKFIFDAEKIKMISSKLRVVPFNTISGEGILPAFKPDYVEIYNKNSKIKKEAYVAICKNSVLGQEYDALINPEIFE